MSSGVEPRTLAGRYRLDEVLGRGGMSTVYRGTDLELDRTVAVKVALDPLVEQSPIYLERFKREATAGAAIDHPGVVKVYDAGADGPTRFIVMEFVPGKSLADSLREHSPLEPAEAAGIAAQAADALSAAHARGIIHRDIKPGNIMVTPDGSVKVLDFGIARAVDSGTLTQTATVLGTSAYMSPEQALGQPADARSDIYSLGCVLYEMLTGKPPFIADVAAAVMHQHVRVEPKPAIDRNPAISPALNDVVMQMLAKDPKDRPQTAAEVRDRLRHAVGNPGAEDDAPTTLAMSPLPPPPANPGPSPAAATSAAATPPPATPPAATPAAATPPAATPRPQTPRSQPRTSAPPPTPTRRSRSRTGLWATLAVIAALLLGGAVALALNTAGRNSSSTGDSSSGHSAPPLTSSHSSTAFTHSSTSPAQTTSHSTSTHAPTTPTSRSTPTPTTQKTTTTGPTTSTNAPTVGTSISTSGGTTP